MKVGEDPRKIPSHHTPRPVPGLLMAAGLSLAVCWSYLGTLRELARVWSADPTYSHGYLVVAAAAYLLWRRRHLPSRPSSPPSIWGLAALLVAAGCRLLGAYYYLVWVERISLLPTLGGVCLLVGGRRAFRWGWLPIAFLVFMIPLPGGLGMALAYPLKRFATLASAYLLQALGFTAVADGTVLLLNEHEIGVVNACSGLAMLTVFVAASTLAAVLMHRLMIIRILVVVSAVPISLVANVARITISGVLAETLGSGWAQKVGHDLAGWMMMVLAVALLWLEVQVLTRLFQTIDEDPEFLERSGDDF